MRNLKFKFLLPVAAFMLAIAAAFASQTEEQVESALVQGYIYQNGVCVPHGKCDNSSTVICSDGSRQVFGKNGPTTCSLPLFMNWQP
ncbi:MULTISPECIES: DUF6520 family protein [Aequorivita]|uniref:Secreted protein n=1 Tax=Aequorivita iocasae TaxID=2803865 RepID=A0ABX7DX05_9FLAO|nr:MULTISPECIES: DUF6520 family protein [Aequorivita]QQX78107.1 hypothetical protein JK629_07580 [Aequorivita iocasae]UCA57618.1 DUF6520 family protein [Aequorivita sp. F7]